MSGREQSGASWNAMAVAMSGQRYGKRSALSADEVDELLSASMLCRVATTRENGAHVTPMWFVWDGSALWIYSIVKSKRWRDLMTNSGVAIVVDTGDDFSTYRGVELKGQAKTVGDVPRIPTPDPSLATVERMFARKYNAMDELQIDGRHAWLCLEPKTVVSWHFGRLLDLRGGVAFHPT